MITLCNAAVLSLLAFQQLPQVHSFLAFPPLGASGSHNVAAAAKPSRCITLAAGNETPEEDQQQVFILPGRTFQASEADSVPTIDLNAAKAAADASKVLDPEEPESLSKRIVISLRVPPKNQKIWEAMALELSELAAEERGCLAYSFSRVEHTIDGYQLVVEWADEAAEQAHWASRHFMRLAPAMTNLCETLDVTTSTPLVRPGSKPKADQVVIGQIELNRKMTLAFTCKKCDTRNIYKISRVAYYQGVVICTCSGCQSRHLIADNKGLLDFPEFGRNIEDYMESQGERCHSTPLHPYALA
eukprot:TRINITY_DN791_c0_g1_i3.p1 TRINITY_DN791_c0_g1~~TRINITY_DN791_c0_g1_i3.p1  ORF type:complete len:301 (-),score=76.21 TRINITY_DN791_c0_g1_i3:453-1355(-)